MSKIRLCTVEDLPQLREVAIETFTDTFKENTPLENLQQYFAESYNLTTLEEELNHPHSEVYLLEEDGEIAAYLKINWLDAQTELMGDDTLEVQRIYVRPDFKRKGYGNQLMELAKTRAKALNLKSIWLGVWEKNFAAQAFYQAEGFEHVGDHEFIAGDQVDIDWIMKKTLK